jgi:hypothetical protein
MKLVSKILILFAGIIIGVASTWCLLGNSPVYVVTNTNLKDSRGVILPKGTQLAYAGFVHTAGFDEGYNRFVLNVAFYGRGDQQFQQVPSPKRSFWEPLFLSPDIDRDYFFEDTSANKEE